MGRQSLNIDGGVVPQCQEPGNGFIHPRIDLIIYRFLSWILYPLSPRSLCTIINIQFYDPLLGYFLQRYYYFIIFSIHLHNYENDRIHMHNTIVMNNDLSGGTDWLLQHHPPARITQKIPPPKHATHHPCTL